MRKQRGGDALIGAETSLRVLAVVSFMLLTCTSFLLCRVLSLHRLLSVEGAAARRRRQHGIARLAVWICVWSFFCWGERNLDCCACRALLLAAAGSMESHAWLDAACAGPLQRRD